MEKMRVAAKLREDTRRYLLEGRFCNPEMGHRLAKAIGCRYFGAGPQISDLFPRLADLIEPSEPKVKCVAEVKVDGERLEQLVHDAAVELTGIDRDALLSLADEMDKWALTCDHYDRRVSPLDVTRYARRIREALGVIDG